jgi:NitT/TauT family transport system permease protein
MTIERDDIALGAPRAVSGASPKPSSKDVPSMESLGFPRRRTPAGKLALRLLPGVVFVVIWQSYALASESTMIPTATATFEGLVEVLRQPETWQAFGKSTRLLLVGFVVSVVIGVPLGFLMGRVHFAEKLADPWLDLLVIVPMAAVIPLVIMALGLGMSGQVFVIVLFTVSMVAVNCRAGVREVPGSLVDMARVYGANGRQVWTRVLLPGASPAVFAGLRIGLGRAILGMVLVEMLMTAVGVGMLLTTYRARYDYPGLYAVVLLIVLESVLFIGLLKFAEARLLPWSNRTSQAD